MNFNGRRLRDGFIGIIVGALTGWMLFVIIDYFLIVEPKVLKGRLPEFDKRWACAAVAFGALVGFVCSRFKHGLSRSTELVAKGALAGVAIVVVLGRLNADSYGPKHGGDVEVGWLVYGVPVGLVLGGLAGACRATATRKKTEPELVALVFAIVGLLNPASRADEPPTFERDIKPLFAKKCIVCHNAKKRADADISGGLALDSFSAALEGTKEHKILVPGKPGDSELLRRLVASDEDERMPLFDKPLTDSQRKLIASWVAAGAPQGVPTNEPVTASRPQKRRIVRSLDVVIPLDAKLPANSSKKGQGGPVQIALKVGPLPAITALAFRGDGRLLAVGTHGAVIVWDLAEGRPATILTELPGPVHALAFSRDGKRLAIGAGLPARSGCVRVYAVPGGSLIHDFEGHTDVVFGLAFRPDGGQLASVSLDQTVRFWNLGLGRLDGVFRGHSDFVYDVAYTPDGRSILTASKDRTIKRIDARTAKEKLTYSGHNDDVLAVAIQPRGSKFVTAGNEPTLRWWALDGETPTARNGGHSGPVHQLVFNSDGRRLISAAGDGSVRVWDGNTGSFQRTLPGAADWQYAAALSSDGRLAAAAGWDGQVRVWDADAGKLRATLIQPPADDPTQLEWMAVAPSGYLSASPALSKMTRWKVGGTEVPGEALLALFRHPEEVAHALQGQPVAALTLPKTK